jgi:hypothetical protein
MFTHRRWSGHRQRRPLIASRPAGSPKTCLSSVSGISFAAPGARFALRRIVVSWEECPGALRRGTAAPSLRRGGLRRFPASCERGCGESRLPLRRGRAFPDLRLACGTPRLVHEYLLRNRPPGLPRHRLDAPMLTEDLDHLAARIHPTYGAGSFRTRQVIPPSGTLDREADSEGTRPYNPELLRASPSCHGGGVAVPVPGRRARSPRLVRGMLKVHTAFYFLYRVIFPVVLSRRNESLTIE